MKKNILFMILFLIPYTCFALPKTYERGENNYYVPSDVLVDENNKEDILNTPAVDAEQKIYDFTDSLTEEEESKIHDLLISTVKDTKIDSVIVFTDNLNGFSISDYAYHFYDYNDYKSEGILLVIYLDGDNPELFMATSGKEKSKIFKVFSNDMINTILKKIYYDHIQKNEYYEACEEYNLLTREWYLKNTQNVFIQKIISGVHNIPWFELIVISISFAFIIIVLLLTKLNNSKLKKNFVIKNSINENTKLIQLLYDRVVNIQK